MNRIIMYTNDIIRLTDKSESYARKEMQKIKTALHKKPFQKVTIREYCHYYGLDHDEVVNVLGKFKK